MTQTCETCRFWQAYASIEGVNEVPGECRRYPPRLLDRTPNFMAAERRTETMWPDAWSDYWCGEWQRREGAPA